MSSYWTPTGGSAPTRMSRFASPVWRLAGNVVGWVVFTASFLLLFWSSLTVMGMGGFCASGGPYVIEDECPDTVLIFVPLVIFTGLAAVGIAAFFGQGFGTPLLAWAWPVLFVGLGIGFLYSSTMPGGITFLIIGVMFVAMGLVPLWLEFRASPQRLFLGTTNWSDTRFVEHARARWTPTQFGQVGARESGEPVPAAAGDWILAIGLLIASIAGGSWLAWTLWLAASAAGG